MTEEKQFCLTDEWKKVSVQQMLRRPLATDHMNQRMVQHGGGPNLHAGPRQPPNPRTKELSPIGGRQIIAVTAIKLQQQHNEDPIDSIPNDPKQVVPTFEQSLPPSLFRRVILSRTLFSGISSVPEHRDGVENGIRRW